jgi:hypothetical protein
MVMTKISHCAYERNQLKYSCQSCMNGVKDFQKHMFD